ncbi:DUF4868 domain-containing protein [bacterium]|nr:DUF4868 domain-containing protein [bacterium]
MSLNIIKEISERLKESKSPSLYLLNINITDDIGYSALQIELGTDLKEFIDDLSKSFAKKIQQFQNVIEYNGSAQNNFIYKISSSNHFFSSIQKKIEIIKKKLSEQNVESNPLTYENAYILQCSIDFKDGKKTVILVSMQNPTTRLKHKFLYSSNTFSKITDKVLNLRTMIDVVIINDTVYFLNLDGEKLFNLERAYKNNAQVKIQEIQDADIIDDFDLFKKVAESGFNPRRFMAYNKDNLESIKNTERRKQLAKQFSIALNSLNKFNIANKDDAEKVIKLLCDKAALEPFNQTPIEVEGTTKWK